MQNSNCPKTSFFRRELFKRCTALILTVIMILQILCDVNITAMAVDSNAKSISGSISYSGDENWSSLIRPGTFDVSSIKLQKTFPPTEEGGTELVEE